MAAVPPTVACACEDSRGRFHRGGGIPASHRQLRAARAPARLPLLPEYVPTLTTSIPLSRGRRCLGRNEFIEKGQTAGRRYQQKVGESSKELSSCLKTCRKYRRD